MKNVVPVLANGRTIMSFESLSDAVHDRPFQAHRPAELLELSLAFAYVDPPANPRALNTTAQVDG